ncbi:hypothetical protein HPB50_016129 [Hyalomma asiaticum]|uniref:Uncharacterized protein n=1 Tax=Hyalomma asiaticum TaxID=266040 RepID=A0ACB7TH84_HYAAI|nr:hypothetical protein HPB50_016129 [Hyalomma asiaticum]
MGARDEHQNSTVSIRNWMGHFEDLPNVAQHLARMGQCFSSSKQSVRVQPCYVQVVPDIVGGVHPISKKPYIFSDGVGMMFMQLAEEVYKVMKLKGRLSGIQIRYAGAKGMLCVNPALPDKKLLCLRDKMQKFLCFDSEHLEVAKVSSPRFLILSRPLITILEQLAVPKHTFACLQERMILEFTDTLVNESSAVEVLTARSKLKLPYKELSEAGFQFTLDPFFRSLLLAVYRSVFTLLRNSKVRITSVGVASDVEVITRWSPRGVAGGTTGTQGPERSRCGFCPDERLLFARAKFRIPRARVCFFRIIAALSRDSWSTVGEEPFLPLRPCALCLYWTSHGAETRGARVRGDSGVLLCATGGPLMGAHCLASSSGHTANERFDRMYITVTALGRDWQVWFLEELLFQRWLPQRDLEKFLTRNPQAGQTK